MSGAAGYSLRHDHRDGWIATRDRDGVVIGSTKEQPELRTKEDMIRFLKSHAAVREAGRK